MAIVPQAYPLWLAEKREGEIRAGRILGWRLAESTENGLPGPSASNPIVAFTTQDGLLMDIGVPHSPLVFIADTREEAMAATRQLTVPAPAPAPVSAPAPDEHDDARPPDVRPRVQVRRRPTLRDMTTEPSNPDAGSSDRTDRRPPRQAGSG